MTEQIIPLFPLEVVLFPHTTLPLHIFEERYKEMISEIIAINGEFGVLCSNENGMATVGCTAQVVKETHRYDDGRMDILTIGRRRFRNAQLQHDKSYLQGSVLFLTDEPGEDPQELKSRCLHLFQDLYESTPGHMPAADLETVSAETVSYYISYYSDFSLTKKQSLLEIISTEQRLIVAEEALKELLLAQDDDRERRRILRGNGHFPHK